MVWEGDRVLIEVRAVDESRDQILSTKFLWLDSNPKVGGSVRIFEPGVLEHEVHAQVRLQLRDGESFALDLLSKEVALNPSEKEHLTLAAAVTITFRQDRIMVLSHPVDGFGSSVQIRKDADP